MAEPGRAGGHDAPRRTSAASSARSSGRSVRSRIDKLNARTLGTLRRRASPLPRAPQRPPFIERHTADGEHDCVASSVHARTPAADGRVDGPADPLDHQRRTVGGRSVGLDRAQPRSRWLSFRGRRLRNLTRLRLPTPHGCRRGVRRSTTMGSPRPAGDDHWDAAGRAARLGRPATSTSTPRRSRSGGTTPAPGRRRREGHEDAPDAAHRARLRDASRCRGAIGERAGPRTADFDGSGPGLTFVFARVRCPDHGDPYSSHAVSSRYTEYGPAARDSRRTCTPPRHDSATESPTAGVDLRTVVGRLGHRAVARRRCAPTPRGPRHRIEKGRTAGARPPVGASPALPPSPSARVPQVVARGPVGEPTSFQGPARQAPSNWSHPSHGLFRSRSGLRTRHRVWRVPRSGATGFCDGLALRPASRSRDAGASIHGGEETAATRPRRGGRAGSAPDLRPAHRPRRGGGAAGHSRGGRSAP